VHTDNIVWKCCCLTDQHDQLECEHRELRIKYFELKQQYDELTDKMRYFTKVWHFGFFGMMLCWRSICCRRVSVYLSVYLYVTCRYSTKMAKCRITQTTPYDSPGTLVFWCQRSRQNSNVVTPNDGGAK